MSDHRFRRLRAVLLTAVTLGAAWATAAGARGAAISVFYPSPGTTA